MKHPVTLSKVVARLRETSALTFDKKYAKWPTCLDVFLWATNLETKFRLGKIIYRQSLPFVSVQATKAEVEAFVLSKGWKYMEKGKEDDDSSFHSPKGKGEVWVQTTLKPGVTDLVVALPSSSMSPRTFNDQAFEVLGKIVNKFPDVLNKAEYLKNKDHEARGAFFLNTSVAAANKALKTMDAFIRSLGFKPDDKGVYVRGKERLAVRRNYGDPILEYSSEEQPK